MLLAKENLEGGGGGGREITVNNVACPKYLLEIIYGEPIMISFYAMFVYSFNYCFYIILRSV